MFYCKRLTASITTPCCCDSFIPVIRSSSVKIPESSPKLRFPAMPRPSLLFKFSRWCTNFSPSSISERKQFELQCSPFIILKIEMDWAGFKLDPDSREKWLLPPGILGRSDSQIGRSSVAKLRHFLSIYKQISRYTYLYHSMEGNMMQW